MKSKNMREMERHWAEQQKKMAKKAAAAPKPKSSENVDEPAEGSEPKAPEKK